MRVFPFNISDVADCCSEI